MLKIMTVYDHRQHVCAALRSGKYKLSNRVGYRCEATDRYCAIGAAAAALGLQFGGREGLDSIGALESKLGITPYQRHQIERISDESSRWTRVASVCAYIEALP